MEYSTEIQMVIDSLSKDKRELLDKVSEIDRLIKRIKYGNLNLGLSKGIAVDTPNVKSDKIEQVQAFPLKSELKVQIIEIFDILGAACKLKDVQDKYKELTGMYVNLRETLKT